ncbi:esterase/lipase family protein [Luteolibacter luteus]|uniref:Alpha/beta hydrolase n=1 Tax=Luteolibacter luteus TaxID=2728835 RepID=A0A858RG67_9BACT|nr:alpha/beta hydrolase [Luteolibacter luteus]QJE95705.1 alpha/beta hydrolase [Luteolibacter luteus]
MKRALLVCLALLPFLTSCGNFRRLAGDLKVIDEEYRIYGVIRNADTQKVPVYAGVVEWHRGDARVYSGDRIELPPGGAFAFSVKSPLHQHVVAFADRNRSGTYDSGEPMWIHTGTDGKPSPVKLDGEHRAAKVDGQLSSGTIPRDLHDAMTAFLAGRSVNEVVTNHGVRLSVGEGAKLDEPRFAATRGEDGLWTPATMAITSGFGIYFLEPYDPSRTPVLFIHGAAGSPQDWRFAMERLDRQRYQAWFAFYPSGGRLDNSAELLNQGVKLLHQRYEFRRLHVVAHSMGGLMARRFVQKNVLEDRQKYINTFITFSSPWGGHEAAAAGVKWAPSVVPSWRDMEQGSSFLDHLFDQRLKGKVNHHLFYSHHSSRSFSMPAENDGTVSVASQLRPEAKDDAVSIQGYNEDHVSILSAPAALTRAKAVLDAATP